MPKTIFIVEDDQDISELLEFNLKNKGFNIRAETHGEKAYDRILGNVPDLLILDVSLPGISGIQICKYLKNNEKTQKLPILMLTARTKKSDRIQAMEAGADAFITKPFSLSEVFQTVNTLLNGETDHKN